MSGVFPQGHALVIGVGAYQHLPNWNVPVTVRDAEALVEILCDGDLCGYPPAQVRYLHQAGATKGAILDYLKELAQGLGTGDTLLLFYAGHGLYDTNGAYCLSAHDSRAVGAGSQARLLPGTGINENELFAALRKLPVKRLLFFINACFSGNLSPHLAPGAETDWPDGGTLSEPAVRQDPGQRRRTR